MSIDWVTVIAQIGNFLVLVWLLKRFLYKPILNGIDAREAEIATRMGEAGRAREQAAAAEADYIAKKQKLLAADAAIVKEARQQAEAQRDALLAEARAKMAQEQKDWRTHLDGEQQRFTAGLYKAGAATLYELARKALHDLADESLEERMALHVVGQLRTRSDELLLAAGNAAEAIATTHAPLSKPAQEQLAAGLQALLPGASLRFVTDEQQAPGLVLRIGSAQLAWTLDSYTEELVTLLTERMATGESGRGRLDG